ncbi:hypothetical protein AMTR_s00023p00230000 [Amborella trichopoda]|uniref:Myb-like domain-containing protein n=1 Tax=Amborella trichopoda TaxID=13333 RepID=W1NKK8_AMBTC|nr:hypothetical protein AMTR_s00023p00230000 [Amborella trichopoda]
MESQDGSSQDAETKDDPIKNSASNVDPIAPPKFPKWTKHEIVVLIEGKKVEESRGKKYKVFNSGPTNTESKWSNEERDGALYPEPIRGSEWERSNKDQSFWLLMNDLRRESTLPGFF